ncbi:MAG: glycosyltransferase N-terminal domain-containing protein [Planctomycetota bacterium]|nr:glycosyltransferase N-terminal domain-containing protein [Planctomycetota bacterium]
MRYIYNLIYLVLFAVFSPVAWIQKHLQGKSRPGIWKKFFGSGILRRGTKPCILFHAVSLGEVNAIGKLVLDYKKLYPEFDVVISTTTQTGQDAAKKLLPHLEICWLPFDFSWAVKRFLHQVKPNLIVLAELEIWPNLLAECKRQSIATCLVNARMSETSFNRYRRLGTLFRRVFNQLDLVCVQNQSYHNRFQKLGVDPQRIIITGNLKYDSLLRDRAHPKIVQFRSLVNFQPGEIILLAGSTQSPEESMAIETYLALEQKFPKLRLFLCPRHPERFDEIAAQLESKGVLFSRRSLLENSTKSKVQRNLLLDSVGELRYWWGLADIALVGGSFGNRGGQNMMEPAALGSAVCFGPNTRNFVQEVQFLKTAQAAVELKNGNELTAFVQRCLSESEFRQKIGTQARHLLQSKATGLNPVVNPANQKPGEATTACQQTVHHIHSLVSSSKHPTQAKQAA